MKTFKKILVVLVVLSLLAGAGYGIGKAVQASRKQKVMVIPAASVNYGGYWDYESNLEGMAATSATQSVYLSDTQKVDKVLVREGQAVHKGDVLMTYDATLTELNLEKAQLTRQQLELSLDVARQNLETLRNMKPYEEPSYDDPEDPDIPDEPEEDLPDPYELITAVSVLDEHTLSINELVGSAGSAGEGMLEGLEDMLPDDEDVGSLMDAPGSFTNPYRFLVTDGAVIQPSFIAKMKALAEKAGGSVFFTLEIHEGDTYYGATRAAWTLDAASLLSEVPEDWTGHVSLTGIDVGDADVIALSLEQEKNERILAALRTYLEALGVDAEALAEADNPSVEAAGYKKRIEDLKARIEALEKDNEDLKKNAATADGRTVADLEREITELKEKIRALGGDLPSPTPTAVPEEPPTPTTEETVSPTPTPEETASPTPTPEETMSPTPTPTDTPALTPPSEATPEEAVDPTLPPAATMPPTSAPTEEAADPTDPPVPMRNREADGEAPAGTTPMAAASGFLSDGMTLTEGSQGAEGLPMTCLLARRPLEGGETAYYYGNPAFALAGGEMSGPGFLLTGIDTGLIPKDAQYTAEEIREAIREEEETIVMLGLDIREAELGIRAAQKAVEEGMVKAKMDGVITVAGDPEKPPVDGSAFLVLTGAAGLYIRSAIPEKMLGSVKEGDTATISSWMTGVTLSGEIRDISLTPDESGMFGSGSDVTMYPMTIFVSGDKDSLSPGEWAQVTLDGDVAFSEDGPGEELYLWKAFIREEGGVKYVYKRGEDGLLVRQEVTLGELNGDGYEILSGITAEDYIAFPYGKYVKEGAETREGSISELYDM